MFDNEPRAAKSRSKESSRLILPLACALALASAFALADAQPKSPALCVEPDTSCESEDVVESPDATSSSAVKWHPGHYMLLYLGESTPSDRSLRFGYYDEIADNTAVQGVGIYVRWRELERTRGDYAAGIQYLQEEIDKLKSLNVPKRLWVHMVPQAYGSSSGCAYLPQYIVDMGGCVETDHQIIAKFWDNAVRDRYIDLIEALGAAFDAEPYFEGITLQRETAFGVPLPADYSQPAYFDNLRRIAEAGIDAFPNTNVSLSVNYPAGGSDDSLGDLIDFMRSNGVAATGPDTWPGGTKAYKFISGASRGPHYPTSPVAFRIEGSELGYDAVGDDGGYLPSTIADVCKDTLNCTHLFWKRMTAWSSYSPCDSSGACTWSGGILPFINSDDDAHVETGCPTHSRYSACNTD